MTQLYLHIGHYKTGTSALQSWLAEGGLDGRLLYPRAGRRGGRRVSHAGLALPLARDHGFTPPAWYRGPLDTDAAFAELHAELASAAPRKVLISSEEFIQLALRDAPEAALADLRERLAPYRPRLILTLREPLALLTSWHGQISRRPRPLPPFLDVFTELNPDFLAQEPIRARFAGAFGPRALRLIAYRGPGRRQLYRFLLATRCLPPRGAAVPLVNVSNRGERLEIERYAKMEAAPGRTRTKADLTLLADRVDEINRGYATLRRRLPSLPPSALSLPALAARYLALLRPAAAQIALDPGEAEVLRRLAAQASDPALAASLKEAAALIEASQRHRPPARRLS